ncbi:uncharacterized protein LOC120849238 [Ixodes scapularis]|uniref:uncharacterized protein LOC120849238 n=1 Tax=Ixodes scapularis TaxID=6945 RepID=UPI001A9ED1D8|nr:uncharacterized protein LOC120849238 [Ixodes scapularis]
MLTARARNMERIYQDVEGVVYVDAAEYRNCKGMSVVAVGADGEPLVSGTVATDNPETAEEAAIALAVASTKAKIIMSDSKIAIRNFAKGRSSSEALKILRTYGDHHQQRQRGTIQIIWSPAHSSLPGNEAAHTVARGLTRRASEPAQPGTRGDRMSTYPEITNHYRLGRARYPPAQAELTKKQAVAWSLLQTNMYPNPVACSRFYPGQFENTCKFCKKKADLPHILWACFRAAPTIDGRKIQDPEHWEALLLRSDPQDQVWATRLAEEAAEVQGISAVF